MTYQEKEQILINFLKKQVADAQEAQNNAVGSPEAVKYFEGQENQARWTLNLLLDLYAEPV